MKKIITAFLFTLFLSTGIFAQQSIQLEYGLSHGSQKAADSWSLSWYRNDALKSGHVLRVNYDKSNSNNVNEIKSRSLQMDVAKSWHNAMDKKLRVYLESGISGMLINSKNQYDWDYNNDCIYCDALFSFEVIPDLFTEENSILLYEYKDYEYALNIMPGLTIGSGFDVDFGKSFYMGVHCRLNAYYWQGGNEILYYLRYGLNAGWKF